MPPGMTQQDGPRVTPTLLLPGYAGSVYTNHTNTNRDTHTTSLYSSSLNVKKGKQEKGCLGGSIC